MNSNITRVIITLFFALLFVSVQAAPAPNSVDVSVVSKRAACGAHMGFSCLEAEGGSDETSDITSSDEPLEPLESSLPAPAETETVSAAISSETPVSHLPAVQEQPSHEPGTTEGHVDTPELASPIVAIKKNGAALNKCQSLLPVLIFSAIFVLFA